MLGRSLILCCLAAPAAATCPVAADLATGIVLTRDDEATETLRRLSSDQIEVTGQYWDGDAITHLGHGFLVLEYWYLAGDEPDEDSRTVFDYPVKLSAVPRPLTGAQVAFDIQRQADGTTYDETLSITWSDKTRSQIGDCTYTSISGTLTYEGNGYTQSEGVAYLPELGISYLTSYLETGMTSPDYHRVIRISRKEAEQ